jgi:UDP-N-acetylglucosamine 2-epimerase (non-hydrolysing)
LNYYLPKVKPLNLRDKYSIGENEYILVTLHRPSNVDNATILSELLKVLGQIQERMPIVFPMHPRTRKMLIEFGLNGILDNAKNLIITEPLGYLEFLKLESTAFLVLTDSGGVQEETTTLGIPCLTLRENTERPVTIWEGTNELIGSDSQKVMERTNAILNGERKTGKVPQYWDGHAAERLVAVLLG